MKFITKEEVQVTEMKLFCSHPQVEKIWEYGGGGEHEGIFQLYYSLVIKLKNGEKKEFELSNPNNFDLVEEYLQSLPLN